jgi:hypothetical protein
MGNRFVGTNADPQVRWDGENGNDFCRAQLSNFEVELCTDHQVIECE